MFTLAAYTQHFDPVGNSLFASAIVAALPLITLFVTLGGLRWKAHYAALASLLSVVRPFIDELVWLLFRTERSTHTLRLSARMVLLGLLFDVPAFPWGGDLETVRAGGNKFAAQITQID